MSRATADPPLSTTSYAILGLLAVKPGTAYELAKRMERNYRFFWPRAESKLYEAVKGLLAEGAVAAERGATGKRPKTTYRISPKGRRLLRAWLPQANEPHRLSFELLLKVTYADFGDRETLLGHLRAMRDEVDRALVMGVQIGQAYADGDVELVGRTHVNALVWRFLWEQHHGIERWLTWVIAEVEAWPDLVAREETLARIRTMLRHEITSRRLRKAAESPPER